jgi:PTH1 family peptidyl-tRNA hydrolase
LRIGIGPVPPAWDAADFVLGKFNRAEQAVIADAIALAAEGVECWVAEGIEAGMSRYN